MTVEVDEKSAADRSRGIGEPKVPRGRRYPPSKFRVIGVDAAIDNCHRDAEPRIAMRVSRRGIDRGEPPITLVSRPVREISRCQSESRGRARRHGLRRHRSQSQRERGERAADQQSHPDGAAPSRSGARAPARITGSGRMLDVAILLDHRTDPRHACHRLCAGVRKCGFNELSHCSHTLLRAQHSETGIPLSETEGTIPPARRSESSDAGPAAARSGDTCVESHAAATNDSVQLLGAAGDRRTVRMDAANVRDDPTALPRVTLGQALVLHRSR